MTFYTKMRITTAIIVAMICAALYKIVPDTKVLAIQFIKFGLICAIIITIFPGWLRRNYGKDDTKDPWDDTKRK